MRYVAACLFASVAGSLLTVWLIGPTSPRAALAQQSDQEVTKPERPTGPRFPGPDVPRATTEPIDEPSPSAGLLDRIGLTPDEAVNVAVYEKNNRSVVNITTKITGNFLLVDVSEDGTGSGAVLDLAGHILTNYHVVEEAQQIQVTLFDGSNYDAKLMGADPRNDVAILKIEAPENLLHPISFGDSSDLQVGMKVFAIGNPFGLERTMTSGIIASLNRSLQVRGSWTIKSIIQIDAAVNPGNSGGPLLDSHGQLIGINTAIATRTGQSAGVGFAIPINLVRRVVKQLIEHGRVIRPEIGIARVFVTEEGLRVEQLTPGGPAERAGLQGPRTTRNRRGPFVIEKVERASADVIVEADGEKVETGDDLLGYIEAKKPGDVIALTILRDGQKIDVPVTLGSAEQTLRKRPPGN